MKSIEQQERRRLRIMPCELAQANEYVRELHRHHGPLPAARFSLAAVDESGAVRGVAIVGRPKARMLDNGLTLEVNRLCTDGCPNACSHLYGAVRRVAKHMGYVRVITYILGDEEGTSLKAAGWNRDGDAGGGDWFRVANPLRRPHTKSPHAMKARWSVDVNSEHAIVWPTFERPQTQLSLELMEVEVPMMDDAEAAAV